MQSTKKNIFNILNNSWKENSFVIQPKINQEFPLSFPNLLNSYPQFWNSLIIFY